MGKGDKKTRKGKITIGTFGVRRPKKANKPVIIKKKTKAAPAKPKVATKATPAKSKPATTKPKATTKTKSTKKAEPEVKETKEK